MIFPRTKDDIVRDTVTMLSGSKFAQLNAPSSIAGALIQILAQYQADLYTFVYAGLLESVLMSATGSALDNLGVLLGRPRQSSYRAVEFGTDNFKFYIDPTLNASLAELIQLIPADVDPGTGDGAAFSRVPGAEFIQIPAGTVVSTESGTNYTTNITAKIVSGQTSVGVPITAESNGSAFNVSANALRQHNIAESQPALRSIAKYILCTNHFDISNGTDVETDDNYRYFLSQQTLAGAAANETAIRIAALSVPGVSDVILRRWTYGVGTFSVYVVGTTPIVSQGLLNAVYQAVQSVAAFPERFTVTGPEYLGLKLTIGVTFVPLTSTQEVDSIRNSIQLAVIDYINNISLGGQVIINEIIQRAMDVSDKILDVTLTNLQIGTYNLKLNRLEYVRPLLVANQQAAAHQKFYTTYGYITVC